MTGSNGAVEENGRNRERIMECLRCRGLMMVERHYTTMTRHLHARCLNCGFWFDLADVLRFFYRVVRNGYLGAKIRETL